MASLSRRSLLAAAACGAAVSGVAGTGGHAGNAEVSLSGPYLDLSKPQDNVTAYARIAGSLNPDDTSYSWYRGRVTGHRPDEAGRDLMNIIGMGSVRMLPLDGEPAYLMLRKELGFFTDLDTEEVIDTWTNPFLEEEVEVVHLANPNINSKLKPYQPEQGLYETVGDESSGKPFILPWIMVGNRIMVDRHVHIRAKNPLDPKKWRRESSGEYISISDSNTFNVAAADLQDRKLKKVPSFGNWTHRRPWQPWMLMGQASGYIQYTCFTGSAQSLDDLPEQIVALAKARFPEFLTAPTEPAPAESSLARYMRTRKPQPLPDRDGS